jgi:hypothetical protein
MLVTLIVGGIVSSFVAVGAQNGAQPAAAPSAPSGLTYLVNGGQVSLFWTHSSGPFTHYILEAGPSPGTTFFVYPTTARFDPSTLPQLLSAFGASGVGAGDYYVRIRGANGAEQGPATPDVLVPIRAGCQPPGSPTDLTAIVRGTTGWIQWNPGSGQVPALYQLVASLTPGGAPIAVFPTTNPFFAVSGIPPGTYYVSVLAVGCGGHVAASNAITVVAPSDSPVRTPDPQGGGRLPLPYINSTIQQLVAQNPGLLTASCPNPNSKYTLNPFVNAVVDRLRQIDQRFGYNSKPTRGPADNGGLPVVVAGDEIAYHYGADAPEGSPNVHVVDILSSHCGEAVGLRPNLTWRNFTNTEFARWTGAGRF